MMEILTLNLAWFKPRARTGSTKAPSLDWAECVWTWPSSSSSTRRSWRSSTKSGRRTEEMKRRGRGDAVTAWGTQFWSISFPPVILKITFLFHTDALWNTLTLSSHELSDKFNSFCSLTALNARFNTHTLTFTDSNSSWVWEMISFNVTVNVLTGENLDESAGILTYEYL